MKLEEAVKNLAAVIKLHDTVLQSLGQVRRLEIVEENDGVRGGVEGLEAYYHAVRCLHLARLHCIHPTPSYASAIQLLTRAGRSQSQAQLFLVDPDTPILEAITGITAVQLSDLSTQLSALDLAAKRALYAERVAKPVFFDTAFNYIDLPMDDLLLRAGKAVSKPTVVQEVGKKVGEMVSQVPKISELVEGSRSSRSTRESTPAVAGGEEQKGQGKGWLGGWFGRN